MTKRTFSKEEREKQRIYQRNYRLRKKMAKRKISSKGVMQGNENPATMLAVALGELVRQMIREEFKRMFTEGAE